MACHTAWALRTFCRAAVRCLSVAISTPPFEWVLAAGRPRCCVLQLECRSASLSTGVGRARSWLGFGPEGPLGLLQFPPLSGRQVLPGPVDEELDHPDARPDPLGA